MLNLVTIKEDFVQAKGLDRRVVLKSELKRIGFTNDLRLCNGCMIWLN